jgi:carboxymethylenebutenolidase
MNVTTERVELSTADGPMHAYVARPGAAVEKGGIIVFQEAFGVNAHIRDVTERFASLGLIAIAPELFHRTGDGVEGSYTDFDSIAPHFSKITVEGLAADARAAYEWLEAQAGATRIAAAGFCLGGRVAYLSNAELPLRAAISFYGGGIVPDLLDRATRQHGPILMFWGGGDTHIPAEQYRTVADALTLAGAAHEQVVFSQAGHGFFCDARASYDPSAAAQAWALSQAFLRSCDMIQ